MIYRHKASNTLMFGIVNVIFGGLFTMSLIGIPALIAGILLLKSEKGV
jgi:hypothetical protein